MPRRRPRRAQQQRRRRPVAQVQGGLRAIRQALARLSVNARRPRRRQAPRRRTQRPSTCTMLHPAYDNRTWVPHALRLTPTVRVRESQSFIITVAAATPTVLLIGPCTDNTSSLDQKLSVTGIGCFGTAAGLPFGVGSTLVVPQVATTMGAFSGRARMHRFGVSIGCTAPTAPGTLHVSSFVKMGMLQAPIEVGSGGTVPTFNTLAAFIGNKPEMHMRTGNELRTLPEHFAARPLDFVTWSEMNNYDTSAPNDFMDALTPFAAVFSFTGGLDNYVITVHVEWDFLLNDEAGAVLSSAHVLHPTIREEIMDAACGAALATSGLIERAGGYLGGEARAAVRPIMGLAGRVPLALGDLEPLAGLL